MGATYAYLSNMGLPQFAAAMELGRVSALTQWRLTRGVYRATDDVVASSLSELYASAHGREPQRWQDATLPPVDVWSRLPQYCCYLAVPEQERGADTRIPHGVFVHLEHDMNTGRPELRLLLDSDGTWDGLTPVPVYVDRPSLGAALADAEQNAATALRGVDGADVRSFAEAGPLGQIAGMSAWMILPLVLTMLDPAQQFRGLDAAGPPRQATPDDKGIWRPAKTTQRWDITYSSRPTLRLV